MGNSCQIFMLHTDALCNFSYHLVAIIQLQTLLVEI